MRSISTREFTSLSMDGATVMLRYIMSHYVALNYVTLCCVAICHIMLRYIMSHYVALRYSASRSLMLRYLTPFNCRNLKWFLNFFSPFLPKHLAPHPKNQCQVSWENVANGRWYKGAWTKMAKLKTLTPFVS